MKDRQDSTTVHEGRNQWEVCITYWKHSGSQLSLGDIKEMAEIPVWRERSPEMSCETSGQRWWAEVPVKGGKRRKEGSNPCQSLHRGWKTNMASPSHIIRRKEMPREGHSWQLWVWMTTLKGQKWIAGPVFWLFIFWFFWFFFINA